jgi:hypothetical protein
MPEYYIRETPNGGMWDVRDESSGNLIATVNSEKLAEAIHALLDHTRLIACVEGGCLQGLSLDNRLHDFLAGYLVDFDTEGCEIDEDRGVFDIDGTYGRCTVAVGEYGFDPVGVGDEDEAVNALLDPSLRMKPDMWERDVTGTVLFSDGTWELHTVKVRLDHNYGDEKSWTIAAKLLLSDKAAAELKAKKKKNVHVTDVSNYVLGDVVEVEEPEDDKEEEAEGDEDSGRRLRSRPLRPKS